jgi:hypothetical protein
MQQCKSNRIRNLTIAAVFCICAPFALAQDTRGTILGRILDPSGAVLPNAAVRAVNTETGVTLETHSNDSGNYSIPFVLPGTYNLSAEVAGFKSLARKGIEVRVGDHVEVDLRMAVGDTSESIEVIGTTPILETSSVSLGQVVDNKRIEELPIQSGNAAEFVLLSPGTTNATDLRSRKAAFNNAPSQVVTDGNAQYSNEFAIDGVPNTFASGTTPRVAFSPPQAAIAEFRVQTTTYDAALGHTPGAVVNTITSGGTNQLHGEAHEFLGNSALDAKDFFTNRSGKKKIVYQDNRYGASAGGPVVIPGVYNGRNRTFFFYAYEGNKWGTPVSVVNTVPTEAEKAGDFSALLNLGSQYQLYDPRSTTATGTGHYTRKPISGNILPATSMDPVASAINKYWPGANTPGTADGRNNYAMGFHSGENYYVHFMRFDHNFSDRSRLFLRLDYDNWEERKNQGGVFYAPPVNGLILNRINRGVALDEVYTLSPSTVLNVRYGLTQQDFPERRMSQGFDLASLGFSSALVGSIPKNLATLPNVTFSNFNALSGWESGDGANTGMVHAWTGSLTTLKGNHSIQYGGEFRLYRNFQNRYPYDVSPSFTYNSGAMYTNGPSETDAAAPMGADLAQFMLGIPQGQMQRSGSFADQDTFFGFYLQDNWKLTRRLTVTAGLRIEHESPVSERFDRSIKGFDYTAVNPIAAQAQANYALNPIAELPVSAFQVRGGLRYAGGANGHELWNGQAIEWLPRFGIAYQLNDKTVIRTGYGIFFDSLGTNWTPAIQPGFTATTPIIPTYDNGVTFAASLANPFPGGLQAPVGSSLGLATNLGQNLNVYPVDRKLPYVQRWSFGLQREFPSGFLVDASYVGNRGTRLNLNRELNYTDPQYLSTSPVRDQTTINYLSQSFPNPFYGLASTYGKSNNRAGLLKPYPEFGNVQEAEPIGYSFYNALQATVQKRFSHGYTLNVAYTWSKMMDGTSFLNSSDPTPWYGISTYDRSQRIVVSGVWEVPVGRGRYLASTLPKWADYAIGGWQLNGVVSHQSGDPLTWGNVIFTGDIHNITLPGDKLNVSRWLNVDSGFERASAKQLASNIRTFPLRFSGIRGDGQNMWNLSATKYFQFAEKVKFQLRAEAYNAMNHPNFSDPNLSVTSSAFGTITSQNGGARQFQIAGKVTF